MGTLVTVADALELSAAGLLYLDVLSPGSGTTRSGKAARGRLPRKV